MNRAFKIFALYVRVSVQNFAAYRFELFVRIFVSLAHLAAELLAVWTVFSNTDTLKGWRKEHMLVLVGVFRMVAGGIRMFIVPNMRRVMDDIRNGTFDFVLLKPLHVQFHISVREFVVWRIADVLLGASVAMYGCYALLGKVPVDRIGVFVLMMIASMAIVYAVWLSLAAACFWLVRVENIEMIFWNIFEAGRYPVQIYPPWVQTALTYIIPIAFITTFPAAGLLGDPNTGLKPWTPFVAMGFAVLVLFLSSRFWRFGLSRYAGASA